MISIISFAYIILAICLVCLTFFVRRNIKVLYVHLKLIINLSCHKKSDGQSLIADITIGLVLGTVVGVGVLSVLNNETSLHLDKTPSKLEVFTNINKSF